MVAITIESTSKDKGFARTQAMVCGLVVVVCVAVCLIALFLRPRNYTSHRDVVAEMIQRRGHTLVTYNASLKWPEGVNYYAYGAGVYPYSPTIHIRLDDSREIDGMIECRNDKYDCSLTLLDLGIEQEIMPDIQREPRYRGPPWLNRMLQSIGVTL
jgi:hypothetical protein